ncbi:DUF6443 domain-containing protein [Chitinophaga flava]|uniref:DUF6443 domain-containing protein n=1 Tax=Chitinophaga flava TaxID=2259036 RepID=UPI00137B3CFC|nr:DUF6443 domain-containing protein [Chitinophaga flava]
MGVSAELTWGQTEKANQPEYIPNPTLNRIRTWQPIQMFTSSDQVLNSFDPAKSKLTVKYFDGLGRPLQDIVVGYSPTTKDLVRIYSFDKTGRQQYNYLPYISNNGNGVFNINAYNDQQQYLSSLYPDDNYFYSQTVFENSPLNRVQKKLLPGINLVGSDRGDASNYEFNKNEDDVKIWKSSEDYNVLPVVSGVYPVNSLRKDITISDRGLRTVSFIDKVGRLILSKTELNLNTPDGHQGWVSTYYIYDEDGNPRMVISPKAVDLISSTWTLSSSIVDELCYQTYYDKSGRLVKKKNPGRAQEEMVYDRRDRVMYVKDGNTPGQWKVNYYDSWNRMMRTGISSNPKSREQLQQEADFLPSNVVQSKTGDMIVDKRNSYVIKYTASNSILFTSGFFADKGDGFEASLDPGATNSPVFSEYFEENPVPSIENIQWLSFNYYDGYFFPGATGFNNTDFLKLVNDDQNRGVSINSPYYDVQGLKTGEAILVPELGVTITTTYYYDTDGRVIQTIGNNSVGGINSFSTRYTFDGLIASTYHRHTNNLDTEIPQISKLTVVNKDITGRTLQVKCKLNNETDFRTIVSNKYNELGKLSEKSYGSALGVDKFEYDARGHLISMNKDFVRDGVNGFFGYELLFDKNTSSSIVNTGISNPRYDGNVAAMIWRGSGQPKKYEYVYDNLSRLLQADYTAYAGDWSNAVEDFTMKTTDNGDVNQAYDYNGNIKRMLHFGAPNRVIDDLVYSYENGERSNRLKYIYDKQNDPTSTLGDFKEPAPNNVANINQGTPDYGYDNNGNLIFDLNKDIVSISYNTHDLPTKFVFSDNSSVSFIYTEDGKKLRKSVVDNTVVPSRLTTTYFDNGFEFQDNHLRSFNQEEGRVRVIRMGADVRSYAFDYFIKDYLGNVRSVITDNKNVGSFYLATMESKAAATENQLFSNLDATRTTVPNGYPDTTSKGNNKFVAKLNGRTAEHKIGPSLVLKVMKGDTIQIGVKAFYKSGQLVENNDATAGTLLLSAIDVLQRQATGGIHHSDMISSGSRSASATFPSSLMKLVNNDNSIPNSRPRAYLNYVLFDEKFNLSEKNSGVKQIKENPDNLQVLSSDRFVIQDNGFLYISTTNESGNDVYFDDLAISMSPGPLLEESHYYPFGLKINAISSNAYPNTDYYENTLKFNGKYLNEKELKDNRGLKLHDFGARMYDAAIGRWMGHDPKSSDFPKSSPYSFGLNNPGRYIDPDGRAAVPPSTFVDQYGNVVGGTTGDGDRGVYMVKGLTRENFNIFKTDTYKSEGAKLGETFSVYSFLEPSTNIWMGHINMLSMDAKSELTLATNMFKEYQKNHSSFESFSYYKSNAGNLQTYDIKTWGVTDKWGRMSEAEKFNHVYTASFAAPGIIMTRRDEGNYAAGMLMKITGLGNDIMISGYGAYQSNGNKMDWSFYLKAMVNYLFMKLDNVQNIGHNPQIYDPGSPVFSDDPGSEQLQRVGYEMPVVF